MPLIQYDLTPKHIAQEETSSGVLDILKEYYELEGLNYISTFKFA